MTIDDVLLDNKELLKSSFGIYPRKRTVILSDEIEHSHYDLSKNKAIIKTDSEGNFDLLDVFRYHFGYDTFYVNSQDRKMINDEEKKIKSFNNKVKRGIIEPNIDELKSQYSLEEHLFNRKYILNHMADVFSVWMQYELVKKYNMQDEFVEYAKKEFSDDLIKVFSKYTEISDNTSHLYLFSELNLPKKYSKENINDILKNMFGSDYDSIEYAVLYGSEKPFSDINIFMVSDKIESYNDGVLNIKSYTNEDFDFSYKNYDALVMDAIFSGHQIAGKKHTSYSLRHKANSNFHVSSDRARFLSVDPFFYNISKSQEFKSRSMLCDDSLERKELANIGISYAIMADELSNIVRDRNFSFTLKDMKKKYIGRYLR